MLELVSLNRWTVGFADFLVKIVKRKCPRFTLNVNTFRVKTIYSKCKYTRAIALDVLGTGLIIQRVKALTVSSRRSSTCCDLETFGRSQ